MRIRVLAATLMLLMSGCSPIGGPAATAPESTPTPVDTTTASATLLPPTPQPTPTVPSAPPTPAIVRATPRPLAGDDFGRLLHQVAGEPREPGGDLDAMWQAIMAEVHSAGQEPYRPPSQVFGYDRGGVPATGCANGVPASNWDKNSYYCPIDSEVVYDESWLREFADLSGPYAPAAILAHEWGHHIQHLLSISGYSIQTELQADCMSGMFLANTQNVLPDVPPDDDPLIAALTTFFGIGNKKYNSTHWFGDREHGSSQQRIRAYGTGYAASFLTPGLPPPMGYGLSACYGYRDFAVSDFASVGDYRLVNLPGRTKQQVDGALVIDPEAGLGFETSGVLLDWLPGATTEDIIALRDTRYPGLRQALPDLKPIDLAGNVEPGSGSATYAEQRAPGIAGGVRSGMISFVVPQTGGGALLLFVYRQAPALADEAGRDGLRVVAEELSVTYEVLARLCSPDDSRLVGEANFKPVCTDDQ